MRSRRFLAFTATLACSGALAVACGSGDDTTPSPTGAAGAAPGSAGAHTGGGTAAGGKTGANGGAASGGTAAGGAPGGGAHAGGTAGAPDGAAGANAEGGAGGEAPLAGFAVKRTDLDSDQTTAAQTDANLINAWGIAINPGAQLFWVASNHGGSVPVYDATGALKPLDPKVPALTGTDPGSPTGQVFNAGTGFKADKFIVDTEDGQILGWPATGDFVQRAKKDGAIYKGLALVGAGATQRLVATDFHDGTVDLYGSDYGAVTVAGAFKDTTIPAGFAPFNVMPIGDKVYVTYAMQDADAEDDQAGPGNGYVSEFSTDGTFTKTLIARGELNSPWAVALAPSSFGALGGMLLVGNFGDGAVHAYDPTSGALVGQLTNAAGDPLFIFGLWDLKVGPTGATDLSKTLFFSAGPGAEGHGVFGKLEAAQ
jgi:uncharacterized protein (TIGR03118 family)